MAPRTRARRSAEDARREILDAAEARVLASGPDALRLQQVAADIGVSHPAILHHFGSRDGLLRAVIARALDRLESDLISMIGEAQDGEESVFAVIELVHERLVGTGYARLLAWIALAGESFGPTTMRLRAVAEAVHARRVRALPAGAHLDRLDTTHRLMLLALVFFGDAVVGTEVRKSAGLQATSRDSRRFLEWLAAFLAAR